jgi:hypothetical protein
VNKKSFPVVSSIASPVHARTRSPELVVFVTDPRPASMAGSYFEKSRPHRDQHEEGHAPIVIHLDNLDEGAIRDWWNSFQRTHKYDSLRQNCSTTVIDALRAGGANKHVRNYPDPFVWDPEAALDFARKLQRVGNGSRIYGPEYHMH